MEKNKDYRVLEHVIDYCDRINEYADVKSLSYEEFSNNAMLVDAVCLCILQIGELSSSLTDEFKENNSHIPWRQIKDIRNIIAHRYGTVDPEIIWEVITDDIPVLRNDCQSLIETIADYDMDI